MLALTLGTPLATRAQPILYTDADATGRTHDGASWSSAYITPHEALAPAGPCPEGEWCQWTLAEGGNGNWYRSTAPGTWTDVESAAIQAGGHLVTVNNLEENTWLTEKFPRPGPTDPSFWIGFYQDKTDPGYSEPGGGWKWISGESVTFTRWRGGEPNDGGVNENYAELHWGDASNQGLWNDRNGDTEWPGIIETLVPVPDCNSNNIPDELDITGGTSLDCNSNGVPDECDVGSNPKGDWRLDEGTGPMVLDSSSNGNDGDIFGNPTWIVGVSGIALHFDGVDDYIEMPDSTTNWVFPAGLTLMAWIKIEVNESNNDVAIVGSHISGQSGGYFLGVRQDRVNFFLANSLPTPRLETATTYNDGVWHDVVGTFDRATGLQVLYVDGDLKARQVTAPPYPDLSPANFRIGAYTEGQFSEKFLGAIDEVKIYDLPLANDCNTNGIPDECDLSGGTSTDCNTNGIPDECEGLPDCNTNGIPDECDLSDGASGDCNTNGIPDECDPDCDSNGVPVDCVVCTSKTDCNDCDGNTIDGCINGKCVHLSLCEVRNPADIDGDGDVDLDDYSILQQCFGGPGQPIPASCPFEFP